MAETQLVAARQLVPVTQSVVAATQLASATRLVAATQSVVAATQLVAMTQVVAAYWVVFVIQLVVDEKEWRGLYIG